MNKFIHKFIYCISSLIKTLHRNLGNIIHDKITDVFDNEVAYLVRNKFSSGNRHVKLCPNAIEKTTDIINHKVRKIISEPIFNVAQYIFCLNLDSRDSKA